MLNTAPQGCFFLYYEFALNITFIFTSFSFFLFSLKVKIKIEAGLSVDLLITRRLLMLNKFQARLQPHSNTNRLQQLQTNELLTRIMIKSNIYLYFYITHLVFGGLNRKSICLVAFYKL